MSVFDPAEQGDGPEGQPVEINEVNSNVQSPSQDDDRASLLAQLGGIRQDIKENAKPLHLEIPGYKGLLWVRFRPYSVARTESKVASFQKAQKRKQPVLLAGACDTILDACEQVMLLPDRFEGEVGEDGKNLIPIDKLVPVGFEQRLAELFKIKGADQMTEARQVVLAMYPTEQAVLRASVTINEWLQGELDENADEEFLGESKGTSS